jgi:hypothetical protein
MLPDSIKLFVRHEIFIPQTSGAFMKSIIRNTFDVPVKESLKGIQFKLSGSTFFFKTADNSLWIEFNLFRKTISELERKGIYERVFGFGQCYNFIDPKKLNGEMQIAIDESFTILKKEIAFSKEIFSSIIKEGFDLNLKSDQFTCRLFWIDIANDYYSNEAPEVIDNLKFGFKMNNELNYSYEDDQIRGICAHIRKKDGKHGTKVYRMYLKNRNIIRYESCFDKKTAGKNFPDTDLSDLSVEELQNCLLPLMNLSKKSFEQIKQDSSIEKQLSVDTEKYKLLKEILKILDGNIGKRNLLHISNLIEHGYIQSRVVQDYRLLRKLKQHRIIVPAFEFRNNRRIGQYKLNNEFMNKSTS